jgi:cellulose synthase/poly-beta-1,6-N-acetylglucosamine synthase-like glycosyltransferase
MDMGNLQLEPFWTLMILLCGAAYLLALQMVRGGLKRLESQGARQGVFSDAARREELPFVSVIIPCRDEVQHIGNCLRDLAEQDYSQDRFEVIVMDDRSSDGSGEAARSFGGLLPHLQVIRLDTCPHDISPKKNALRRGMNLARGEIFITTDADCRFAPGWISALVSEMEPHVGLATGLTVFDRGIREPFWQRLQQLDYLSHSFFAAGAIAQGWAFNCNGSNLALRRKAFEDVGGYDGFSRVITGDDTLLLQRMQRCGRWTVRFSSKPQSLVRSWPEERPRDVLNQRLRWGSGGLSYTLPALSLGLSTFIFFLALLASPILWAAGLIGPYWMAILLAKWIQEARVLHEGFRAFNLNADWPAFGILELVHVPAILIFSIGGHLLGFRWKGQRYRRKRTAIPVSEALES